MRFHLAMLSLVFSAGASAAGELPLEYYAELPAVSQMVLSPGGKRLAAIANVEGRILVATKPFDSGQYTSILSNENDRFHINWIRWANDDWVLVSLRYPESRRGVDTMETRLVSVAADGSAVTSMLDISGRDRPARIPQRQDRIVDMLPDDPLHVYLALDLEGPGELGVYRTNVTNGERKRIERPRDHFVSWLTDSEHRVRVGVKFQDDDYEVQVRPVDGRRWQVAWKYQVFSPDQIEPMGFGLDPDVLYVRAYHEGYLAIFKVDLSDPELTRELVWADPGRDVSGRLMRSPKTGDVVGLILSNGRRQIWDEAYLGLFNGLEKAFPGLRVSILGLSRDEQRYLLVASNDREPGAYYVGDRSAGTASVVIRRYPHLTPDLVSGQRQVTYEARDGTRIEAFLTLPLDHPDEPLPAVVLPHGGPIAHTGKEFDTWSEFLANRGYVVMQMNFRGSSGYGLDFMRAGLQKWGLSMQDDVEDAAHWLVDEALADPGRICIVGGSYGGYAALMGAIKSTDVFRCAISFAGVTDLAYLVANSRRYTNADVVEAMVGDKRRDLRQRSPVTLADQIEIPVLLIHGTDDLTVPIRHGRSMDRALTKAGKQHRYIEQPGGDHNLSEQGHRLEFFREMEAFLAEHLKGEEGG